MANLHDIKNRIKSVQSTCKITLAMKMVAAAKVKKAENTAKADRPYVQTLISMISKLMKTHPTFDSSELTFEKAIENYPVLLQRRKVDTAGLLVVTSDKGLAGAYNTNVIKKAVKTIDEYLAEGLKVKLFVVGLKGISSLSKLYKCHDKVEIVKTYSKLPPLPTVAVTNVIAEDLAEALVNDKIDEIDIVTTVFKSMLAFKVEKYRLLPIDVPEDDDSHLNPEMLFEPSSEVVLQKIIPLYVANVIYHILIEAAASELASRMNAMSNATKNAEEMIKSLTITYNKERQYKITQDIIEVVSGASAV